MFTGTGVRPTMATQSLRWARAGSMRPEMPDMRVRSRTFAYVAAATRTFSTAGEVVAP